MSAGDGAPESDDDKRSYELGDLELAPQPRPSQRWLEDDLAQPALADLRALEGLPPRGSLPANDFELTLERGGATPAVHGELDIVAPARGGATHFDEEDGSAGPALELDLSASDRPLGPSARPKQAASTAPRPISAPRPGHDERALRVLAGYGPAPRGLGTARYVFRVARRAWVLRHERAALESRAGLLAAAYEEALGALGRALLEDPALHAHSALAGHLANVQAKEHERGAAQHARAQADAQRHEASLRRERERAEVERELAPFVAEESRAAHALQRIDAELKRRKAQVQRAEIELRALGKASVPPPAERVERIETERQERARELSELTGEHAEASAALGRARRELALRRGGLDVLDRQHAVKSGRIQAEQRRLDADVAAAEHALSAALCALAEAAEEVGLAHDAAEQVAGLRASEAALDQSIDQLARYDRALSLYDRDALMLGALIWLAALVALLVALRLLS